MPGRGSQKDRLRLALDGQRGTALQKGQVPLRLGIVSPKLGEGVRGHHRVLLLAVGGKQLQLPANPANTSLPPVVT